MSLSKHKSQNNDQLFPAAGKIRVTILASEWGSSKGGLSTLNREFAIQLAKFPELQISFFVPQCSEEDKKAALSHNIEIVQAKRRPGYDELEWLSFPPAQLQIDVVVGHGVKLGHQAQVIRESHKCKWIQVVHNDPEELGMFKTYQNSISTGEKKRQTEVELCEMADLIVGVGPKLYEAFRRYLRSCKKDESILDITPGVFNEFVSIKHVEKDMKQFGILVSGQGDAEDFKLKGFDTAAKAVAEVEDARLIFVGAPEGKHEEIAKRFRDCGVPADRLTVRSFVERRESLKNLFYEVDVVLMPSRTEGFGLLGLEALSAGLPVLVSKNSGFGEALNEVPFGAACVIDSEDSKVWAEEIKKVRQKKRQTQLQEADELRTSYGKKYCWAKQIQAFVIEMINIVNDASVCEVSGPQHQHQSSGLSLSQVAQKDDDKHAATNIIHDLQQLKIKQPTHKESELLLDLQKTAAGKGFVICDSSASGNYIPEPCELIERICQLYKIREERLLPVPWCNHFSFSLKEIFTRLKIVRKGKTRGEMKDVITNMTAIFKTHEECEEPPRTVLIEGDPGMGKTTYCQKLAYDWATSQEHWDESFPNIALLLLLRCYDIKSNLWQAIDDQLLPDDIAEECKEKFFKFIRENQSRVLFVLDDLDEADHCKIDMFINLAQSKELPKCLFVFTARHESGMEMRRYCDNLWEIVGFTQKDAKNFICKYFRNMEHSTKRLLKEIKSRSDLHCLISNPLNTALLCILCEDFREDFPESRSELYIEIVKCVLRRYEEKKGFFSNNEDIIAVYEKELRSLGRIALQSLLKGELYIEESKANSSNFEAVKKFGFLSIQSGGSKRKPCFRYGFLHKSFQEFFAGFHLALKNVREEDEAEIPIIDKRFLYQLHDVFLYICGVVAMQSEETAKRLLQKITAHINRLGAEVDEVRGYIELAFCLIEECGKCKKSLRSHLLHEFGARLQFKTCTLGVIPRLDFFLESLSSNTFLTDLDVSFISRRFVFGSHMIDDKEIAILSKTLSVNTTLTHLNLEGNRVGEPGAASLSQALFFNTTLTHLNLEGNRVGEPGAASLSKALFVNTALTHLNLGRNELGASGAACLSKALLVNTTLTDLRLFSNGIDASGAAFLYQALSVNNTLTHLNLRENKIGASGADYLSWALSVNTTLTHLYLGRNKIGASGAVSLTQALSFRTTLYNLNLK